MSRRKPKTQPSTPKLLAVRPTPIAIPSTGSSEPSPAEPKTSLTNVPPLTHDEYKDLSDNVRHYNTHFLGLLTVLLGVVAVLLRFVFGADQAINDLDKLMIVSIGFVVAVSFWVQGEVYLYRQRVFERRLAQIEQSRGYAQYSMLIEQRSKWLFKRFRLGRWAWRVFFCSICLIWLYALSRNQWSLFQALRIHLGQAE